MPLALLLWMNKRWHQMGEIERTAIYGMVFLFSRADFVAPFINLHGRTRESLSMTRAKPAAVPGCVRARWCGLLGIFGSWFEEFDAGIAASVVLLVVVVGWTATYLTRVVTGKMTFMEQRRRYRSAYDAMRPRRCASSALSPGAGGPAQRGGSAGEIGCALAQSLPAAMTVAPAPLPSPAVCWAPSSRAVARCAVPHCG